MNVDFTHVYLLFLLAIVSDQLLILFTLVYCTCSQISLEICFIIFLLFIVLAIEEQRLSKEHDGDTKYRYNQDKELETVLRSI